MTVSVITTDSIAVTDSIVFLLCLPPWILKWPATRTSQGGILETEWFLHAQPTQGGLALGLSIPNWTSGIFHSFQVLNLCLWVVGTMYRLFFLDFDICIKLIFLISYTEFIHFDLETYCKYVSVSGMQKSKLLASEGILWGSIKKLQFSIVLLPQATGDADEQEGAYWGQTLPATLETPEKGVNT